MPLDKDLKKWLTDNKMWIKKGDTKEQTHNLMEYGQFLSVRDDKYLEFLKRLAKTIDERKINFLIEIRRDYFKFMVDIDFKSEFGLSIEQKMELIKFTQFAVTSCVNIDNNLLIVSSCKDENIIYDEQKMVKIGFHLIWPHLIVSVDEARFLRSAIIQYLNDNLKVLSFNNWEDIVDNSIYDKNHALRMNGSCKNVKCPKCKAKAKLRDKCIKCKRTGWVNEKRIYKPYLIFNNDQVDNDMLIKLKKNTFENLKMTSIRSNLNESNVNPDIFPNWFSQNKYKTHLYQGTAKPKRIKKTKITELFDPAKIINTSKKIEISETSDIYKGLTKYLKLQLFKLSPEFEDTDFDKLIKEFYGKDKFRFYFSTRNQYCLNMGREHSSNHIYFQIDGRNIVQKCHSPWKNLKGILCSGFRSDPIKLNDEIYKLLFEKEEIKEVKEIKKRVRKFIVD